MPAYNTAVSPQIVGGPQTAGTSGSGDPSWLNTLGTLANLGGSIYGLVNSSNLSKNASTAFAQSNPFGGYRPIYGQQLLSLMQNPGSVTQLPEYQFLMDQGVQAIDRSAAAPGGKGLGSGGEMTDLLTYGQGLASESFMSYAQLLSKLAGADIGPANPAAALQAQGGAATGLGSSIAGLGNSINSTVGLLSKLFPSGAAGGSAASGIGSLGGGTDFSSFASGSGYDPTTGQYSGGSTPSFAGFSQSSGYDPTTGTYSGGNPVSNLDLGSMGGTGDANIQPIDLSGMWSNPSAAGGEAAVTMVDPGVGAATTMPNVNIPNYPSTPAPSTLGTAEGAYSIYQNLSSGTAMGDVKAGVTATNLANQYGAFGSSSGAVSEGLGVAGGALGIVGGIQQGGTGGDIQIAQGTAQAGSAAASAAGNSGLASTLGGASTALGAIGMMYALWQLDQAAGVYTPADQYKALANTPAQGMSESADLQAAIASGKAVMNPVTGRYEINGIDASIYYPLAGLSDSQISNLNVPLAQNFLVDQGADWNLENIGYTGGALRGGAGNHSIVRS